MNSGHHAMPALDALEAGRSYLLDAAQTGGLDCYFWRHPDSAAPPRWLCAVHGIGRDAREQLQLLLAEAHYRGFSLLAPRFDEARYRSYQQLGWRGQGERADRALLRLLKRLAAAGHRCERVDLFGFSGGAQFAHRFTLAYPQRVGRLAVAAAGWYTMPDPSRRFPYGLECRGGQPRPLDLDGFLKRPILVLVGERDRFRDPALRRRPRLDAEQGVNRLARAAAWVEALDQARLLRQPASTALPQPELQIMSAVGHNFSEAVRIGALDQRLFDFLTRPDPTTTDLPGSPP